MTDVVLINANYSNQSQIEKFANDVIRKYTMNTNSGRWSDLLSNLFMSASMSNSANIQFFRERTAGDHYRLDTAPNLNTFIQYAWDNGQFTNSHPFLMNQIDVPPEGTNRLWTFYDVQPYYRKVTVHAGDQPRSLGFYLSLYGLPLLIRANAITATVDTNLAPVYLDDNEPGWFRRFQPDEKRLSEAVGQYRVTSVNYGNLQLKQLSLIDGAGNSVCVLFNGSNPQEKYLAYVQSPKTHKIINMYAWDYDASGNPIRFLEIEPDEDTGTLEAASAQYIIYTEKRLT